MSDLMKLRAVWGNRPLLGVAAGVLIQNERGEVLLQKRGDDGLWGEPGGGLDPGEAFLAAAQRELKEETGLECGNLTWLGVHDGLTSGPDLYTRYPNGHELYLVGTLFHGTLPADALAHAQPDDSGETLELRWCALDDLPPLSSNINRTSLNVLRAFMGGKVLIQTLRRPDGGLQVQSLRTEDGETLVATYLHPDSVREEGLPEGESRPELQEDLCLNVLTSISNDPRCEGLVLEPFGEHPVKLGREQILWALQTPHNDLTKEALISGSMQQVLGSLVGPQAKLLMAVQHDDPQMRPIFQHPQGDGPADTLLTFTSGPEALSVDPRLQVRSAPALTALRFALEAGAEHVAINALSPQAKLSKAQITKLLELADEQQQVAAQQH